jgi:hypothetical protein
MSVAVDRTLVVDSAAFSGPAGNEGLKPCCIDLIERDVQNRYRMSLVTRKNAVKGLLLSAGKVTVCERENTATYAQDRDNSTAVLKAPRRPGRASPIVAHGLRSSSGSLAMLAAMLCAQGSSHRARANQGGWLGASSNVMVFVGAPLASLAGTMSTRTRS